MDLIKSLGELALGSRLKRLSEEIMREGVQIYQEHQVDFEPRWFPVYYSLYEKSPLSVMEIAQETNLKHPTISQFLREMEKKGLVASTPDPNDGRKRLLNLSAKGKALFPKMEPIWKDISNALYNTMQQHQQNMMTAIEEFEKSFEAQSFFDRVMEETKRRQKSEVEIIDYTPELKAHFGRLNREWIEKYFVVEEVDRLVLDHPEEYILSKGGHILFARYDDEIVGTCALIKKGNTVYELSKMAVTESARGKQIGKKLGIATIEKAKELGTSLLYLESNKQLTPALTLYEKLGFRHSPRKGEGSAYERADVYMELHLS